MAEATIDRLQGYLRHAAGRQYVSETVPPFTLFFHPTDDLSFFNYAIPDCPVDRLEETVLPALRASFAARDRQPRFEYVEQFAPKLAPLLEDDGFQREGRHPLMLCTPETVRPGPAVPDLRVVVLYAGSPRSDARDFLTVQRRGFGEETAPEASEAEAVAMLARLDGGSTYFLARVLGAAAAVAVYTAPHAGMTEIAGIATLSAFRRRGIAGALTSAALHRAFDRDVELAMLSAADERAGRVYERAGFRPYAQVLHFLG